MKRPPRTTGAAFLCACKQLNREWERPVVIASELAEGGIPSLRKCVDITRVNI